MTSSAWFSSTSEMDAAVSELYSKGVFLVTAAGNRGIDESYMRPNYYAEFFPVSSIDHEDRGEWRSIHANNLIASINIFDPDYYSAMGHLSGDTEYGRNHCSNPDTSLILCSSYGSNSRPVRFAMPGHYITLMSEYSHGRPYPVIIPGTSVSAPLLAGAALVAIYAYAKGYFETNGVYRTPTLYKLIELLESVGSQSSAPDRFLGVGYVDIGQLYDLAYTEGLECTCEGGGGGGGNLGGFWR